MKLYFFFPATNDFSRYTGNDWGEDLLNDLFDRLGFSPQQCGAVIVMKTLGAADESGKDDDK